MVCCADSALGAVARWKTTSDDLTALINSFEFRRSPIEKVKLDLPTLSLIFFWLPWLGLPKTRKVSL